MVNRPGRKVASPPTVSSLVAWRNGAFGSFNFSTVAGTSTTTCLRDLAHNCQSVDQPAAALVKDLEERGMLEDTMVIFGGEFGRTIYGQGKLTEDNHGRDHHGRCFTTWVTGGGFQGGLDYGKTDDYAYNIIEDPVHINDFNATVLHNLGIDHERFSVKHQGLDSRLTGVETRHVIKDLLA